MELNIDKRNAGCAAVIDDNLYIWGGETADVVPVELSSESSGSSDSDSEGEQAVLPVTVPVSLPRKTDPDHPFDVFNICTRTWSRQPTSGEDTDIPSIGNGSTLTHHPGSSAMYLYAGWNEGEFDSDVYRVSTETWVWTKLHPASAMKPSPRYITGVLLYGDKLCNFGGVGPPIEMGQDQGASYIMYEAHGRQYGFGWNNEYYEFDVYTHTWEAPLSGSGKLRPPPCGAHVFTRFDGHRAVYFGGRRETGLTNDTYIFDLSSKVFTRCNVGGTSHLPCPRVFPTLVSLVNPDLVGGTLSDGGPVLTPRMFLLWGKKTEKLISEEAWIFHPLTSSWTQVELCSLKPRSWHIAQPWYVQPEISIECEVVVFGGNVHSSGDTGDRVDIADVRILSFGLKSLQHCCLSVIISTIGSCDISELNDKLTITSPKIRTYITSAYQASKLLVPIHVN